MFKTTISHTPLTTPAADDYFTHIWGDSYNGDRTFVATLRALVAPRMKEGEDLYVTFGASFGNPGDRRIRDVVYIENTSYGSIRIHSFSTATPEAAESCFKWVQERFDDEFPGYCRLEKVTTFFTQNKFGVICYVNPDLHNVVIFTDNLDTRKLHYLQCVMFAFLPWYFNPAEGLSEIETELIKSLREKTSQKYEDCIAQIAEQYDFRTMKIRKLLEGFETKFEIIERENVKRNIESIIRNINDLSDQIGSYLRDKYEQEVRLLGLDAKIAQDSTESEIMDYFICNNRLALESVTNETMVFVVRDYFTYFDEEMAKRVIDNDDSYIYRPRGRACNNYIPAEDMKMLMKALFIDQTLKMKVCAAYEFRLNGNVRARGGYRYNSDYREYTPNPHIDRFNCLGSYEIQINKFLQSRDYIGAIEQCVASCKSLNFADSAVMEEFMARLYELDGGSVNVRCIELPDGRTVKPKTAIEYLKGEESVNV